MTDIKDAIKQAAEIAELVPKDLREAAFNRALDSLLKGSSSNTDERKAARRSDALSREDKVNQDAVAILLKQLNRTAYPQVMSAPRVLERSLFLLRAASDYDVDGLGASQIAMVLTDKFRVRTTRQAVTQALDDAGDKVDRSSTSKGIIYRLMQPGEDYLDAGNFSSVRNKPSKIFKKPVGKNKPASPKTSTSSPVAHEKKGSQKKKSGRPGPGAMLSMLSEEGFFSQPRSISDIQNHCEKKLAHKYILQELSTPLRRAVHNRLLKREQNDKGQYEYVDAK
ncbi:MAG: hypothetical protein ACK4PK_09865 [Alphaproteobacteria bacterium]